MLEPIGKHIRLVDERNGHANNPPLLGVSIEKVFMPSVANTIGSNMANYKVVKRGQFACSLMQVRRDKKMPVALLRDYEVAIVSPAYPVFEIIDENRLLPEYLMMWMLRPEFDREACFYAVGGVRGSLEWDDLCAMQLPIPSIENQREIVKEYRTVVDRIRLNERLNEKLEEAAQAIYRQWFVDFEFPMTAEYAESIGRLELAGQPYKSSGGVMEYNEVLDQELPMQWTDSVLDKFIELHDARRIPLSGVEREGMKKLYPYYGAASRMDYVDDFLFDGVFVLIGEDGTVITESGNPVLQYVWGKFWVNNHAHVLKAKNGMNEECLYMFLSNLLIADIVTGGVQAKINQANLRHVRILDPESSVLSNYNLVLEPIFAAIREARTEIGLLERLASVLLSGITSKGKEADCEVY